MKNRWIATLLLLILVIAALVPAAAYAEPTALSLRLGVKETYQLDAASIPGAEGKQLIYMSSNSKIATVSTTGLITAKKKGTAQIAVGSENTGLAICTVTVLGAPKKITLSEKTMALNAGETKQLQYELTKKTSSAIAFTSSDTTVATVDASGNVTAVAAGKATITAKTFNRRSAKCAVVVLGGKAPAKLTLPDETLSIQVKERFKLSPSVEEGAEALYAYATANKKIATVSADGVVTGKKKGTTQIMVKTHNGLTATVNVVVKGKLKETYGLLTDKPKTYLKYAKKLKLKQDTTGDSTSVMYYDKELALIMTKDSCQVSLSPSTSPKYCLQGTDTTMTADQVAAKLVSNGWTLADARTVDGIEVRAFTKGGDTTHHMVISADGTSIRSLDAVWTW